MNYNDFLNMMPEAFLVLWLLILFVADFCLVNDEQKAKKLGLVTMGTLVCQTALLFGTMEPQTAFGGLYVTTASVNVMKIILTFGTLIVAIMAQPWADKNKRLAGEFYMLVISTLLGMYMMMSSGNFLMFFLGLEMASVPMACIVAFDKLKKQSAEAAAKYVLTATFSSGVMLYGISFLYGVTGTLYFDDMAAALAQSDWWTADWGLSVAGLVFFFSGLGFKLSLVPFHFWTADTYEGAPTPVTGYLSVISKGAAALALLIILDKVFGSMVETRQILLGTVIMLTITIGNLFAIRQSELKRFMAFSSISQAGYIMLAAMGDAAMGTTALTYYVLVYVVANMAVFTVIHTVEQNAIPVTQGQSLTAMSAYNGFYQTNPKLSFLMTLALFSLAGIPPFAGMFSKFFVFMAAAADGSWWCYLVVFIALINTVVSLYYYLLIVKAMYITKTDTPLPTFQSDMNSRLALALCTAGVIAFGVVSCIYGWISAAAGV